MIKIVQLTTDSREHYRDYSLPLPFFGAAPEALLEGFAQLPEVEIHVVSCLRSKVSSPVNLAPNVIYHGISVPAVGWMKSLYTGCIRSVRQKLREIMPDIVHGQGTERDCALSAVYSGFPNVLTIHGNMAEIQRLGLHGNALFGTTAALLETHSLKRATGVFCNSAYTQELVAPRAHRTWLVPNAIRNAFLSPGTGPSTSVSTPQVLNVGLVSPRKRQLEILRAVRDVVQSGHPMKIVFVGGFGTSTEYERQFGIELGKAESEGYAEYAGFLNQNDLISLMDESQGMIHFPSEEAFGLVVAESMARGLKFFGANLGGIRDIAANIEEAELFHDLETLTESLKNWIKAGAASCPSAATQIRAKYHPKVIASRHLEIYREVIAQELP